MMTFFLHKALKSKYLEAVMLSKFSGDGPIKFVKVKC